MTSMLTGKTTYALALEKADQNTDVTGIVVDH